MDNIIKGTLYEKQILNYIINILNKKAYLWSDCPENILIKNNILGSHNDIRIRRKDIKENELIDTGIDIIQIDDENNNCSIVQCKNGYKTGITMQHLAGFMCWMFSLQNINGYVYYTNKISPNLKRLPKNDRINYIKIPFIEEIEEKEQNIIKPFEYQLDAKNKIIEYFKSNNRGVLSAPCGTGKTYITYLSSLEYDQIIILSPLIQFSKQNLDKYIEYGYKNNYLLVNCEAERNTEEIEKFIKSNDKFLISSTFDSLDVLINYLSILKNSLIIIDEFHNISKNSLINPDNNLYKLLYSNQKILFVSATPRIYELEYDEDYYDLDEIFGEIIYNMNFTDAIENKYICDYNIYLPSISEDNTKLNEELSIYKINETIKAKCNFLISCILNNGSKKCIIYCVNSEELNDIINAFNELNKFYYIDYDIYKITYKNSDKSRTEILNNFTNNKKIQLLFSINILNECIDIPSCDSIYISYATENKISTIQRISRCLRIDKNNKYKIGNIYIWCDEYSNILNTLSSIKEYDINFKDKIKINETNYYNNNENKLKIKEDIKLINKYIIGIKEFRLISWKERLNQLKEYIDENKKLPSIHNKDKDKNIKSLGYWLSDQKKNYKNNEYNMKIEKIKNKWKEFNEEYKEYLLSNEELWYNILENIKKYIDENKKLPSTIDKNKNIKSLGVWLSNQKTNYKKNEKLLKNEDIRKQFEEFIEEYKEYLLSDEEIWYLKLEKIKNYINENKKSPLSYDKNKNLKYLGSWLCHQKDNYKNNKGNMKIEKIKNKWKEFNEEYKEYLLSNEELWYNILENIKKYIDENKKLPSTIDKNKNIKSLGVWLSNQKKNYKNNEQIIKNEDIKKQFEEFLEEYKKYL
jgi:superfamily II DNA or RNA helicase